VSQLDRGVSCPHHCDFCYKDAFYRGGKSFYTQEVDAALAEIERLPGRHIYFLDDHLLGHRRFAGELFAGMRGMGRVFQGASTVDAILRGDLIERAAEAGMRSVFVGFETLDETNLLQHGKSQNLARDYAAVVRRAHSLGVMVNGSFVFGLDEDTPDVFDRTVEWAAAQHIETATFHIMTPYPGTGLHRRLECEGRITSGDWNRYNTRHVVYRPARMTPAELEAGYARAYREFYRWPTIVRSALGQPTARQTLRHVAYAGGWKRLEPMWDALIRLRRVNAMLPMLEATLAAFGGAPSRAKPLERRAIDSRAVRSRSRGKGARSTMRAIEVAEDRSLAVVERPWPEPGPGQVAIDVAYCGICGSDLHFRDVPALFPAGTVPGHEFSGSIAIVGEGVSGWSAGDRACVLPFAQCGECAACRAGDEQVCATAIARGVGLGTGRDGGYAERVVVDALMLFSLPAALDDRAGTLVEPTAVAVHALTRARPEPGELVVVVGAGPVGLLTALVAREQGLEVALISRNPGRAQCAAQLGLRTVAPGESAAVFAGAPPAVVLECAGTGSATALALELVAPLGRVVVVGVAPEPFALDPLPMVFKEVDVRGALAYRRGDFQAAIDLLAAGRIPSSELISDVVGLDRAEETFQSLTAPGNRRTKVLLDPALGA
jgi:2-desacetyl-2-hydroxyethyl bacteriochlorophyllide A dehydrogenase